MNIAYFLTPKGSVAYLYEDCTLRQGLEKLRHHGYSAIPVIRRDGSYVGVVREGDRFSYACPISDAQELRVAVEIQGSDYTILRWRAVSTVQWEADNSITVWDGG